MIGLGRSDCSRRIRKDDTLLRPRMRPSKLGWPGRSRSYTSSLPQASDMRKRRIGETEPEAPSAGEHVRGSILSRTARAKRACAATRAELPGPNCRAQLRFLLPKEWGRNGTIRPGSSSLREVPSPPHRSRYVRHKRDNFDLLPIIGIEVGVDHDRLVARIRGARVEGIAVVPDLDLLDRPLEHLPVGS